MTSPEKNHWEQRYGASRRALDKKLLSDLERQIAGEERAVIAGAINPIPPVDRDAERRRIAFAFGRPLT
jgi:hypothetical protein